MKILFLAGVGSCLLANITSPLLGQDVKTRGDAKSLAAAENAFASEALRAGTRTAFLHVLAEDSVVFESGPQKGRKVWEARKDEDDELRWQPVLAVVSASGDLGYTTGPWSYKKDPDDEIPSAYGEFLSVWRRESSGWKLVVDLGIKHPPPNRPIASLQTIDLKTPNDSKLAASKDELFKCDREYAAAPAKNLAKCAASEVRVYRNGKFPAIGHTAGAALISEPSLTSKDPRGSVSRAGDFGYVWGETEDASGYFLRIWHQRTKGHWELLLDLLHTR